MMVCFGNMVMTWAAMWASMGARGVLGSCSMAEYPCKNKQCVSLDRYCDGTKDCEDGTDEPNACTPCNRTYYGRVGWTYTLTITKPERGTLPHFCQLTFIASGDMYGDLIQISIHKFNLGRFVSHTTAGCPDGYMQIEELSRPLNAGYWCGASWGHNVYYSETSAVSLMLRVFNRLETKPQDNPAAFMPPDSVMLSISYRFLRKERAVLRYGAPYNPKYRGKDITNSFCDRYFENCDKKNCKVQSPNFPGMYPRNLTCYYQIKQTRVPDGKVALIKVYQRNPHLIYIKDRNAPHLSRERQMRVGSACHVLHDYLVAYDGHNTRAAVLATLCKGGAALTGITSSGPDLLLVFHASPFDFPFQDTPRRRTFGFELDVEVEFVDRESTAYVKSGSQCSHQVTSRGQRSGYLQAPAHSLLPNTTCTWRLVADPSEVVWLYFLHYRHIIHNEMPPPAHCSNTLTILDGDPIARGIPTNAFISSITQDNTTSQALLGRFCRPEKLPRVCSGVHAPGPHAAPCSPSESYVSNTPALTLSLRYAAGTAPAHVEFLARYEFVDKRQWGAQTPGGGPCDRTFMLQPDGLFASPRDVFLFGRGGTKKLRCVYTFEALPNQRVKLRIIRSRMGPSCITEYRQASLRYECSHGGAPGHPAIWIREQPWEGVWLTRACLCGTYHARPFSLISYTNRIVMELLVPTMTAAQDYTDFFFEGEYTIFDVASSAAGCQDATLPLSGRHGNFTVGANTFNDPCPRLPRLVTAIDGSFLFLKLPGHTASETNCHVASRINVYAAGGIMPLSSVCPLPHKDFTTVFSSGWRDDSGGNNDDHLTHYHQQQPQLHGKHPGQPQRETRDLLVEVVGNHTQQYLVTWVSVWRPLQTAPLSPAEADLCPHRCPEIQACLPPELWCDGEPHCPAATDEGAAACGILAALPWVYLLAGIILLGSLVALLAAVVLHRRRTLAVNAVATAVVENNSHGVKSATHDLLLPLEKETW